MAPEPPVKMDFLVERITQGKVSSWETFREQAMSGQAPPFSHRAKDDPWDMYATEVVAATLKKLGAEVTWVGPHCSIKDVQRAISMKVAASGYDPKVKASYGVLRVRLTRVTCRGTWANNSYRRI